MSKWILFIALTALALGLALYLNKGGENQGFESLENGNQQRSAVQTPDTPVAQLRDLNGEDSDGSGGSSRNMGSGGTERSSLGHNVAAAAAGGEFHVLLVEPKHRTPVEGMRVYLLDRERLGSDEWRLAGANERDLRKLIKDKGVMQVSDADGGAYFERVLDGAIWAEGSGWQGFFDWIGPPESPLTLTLRPHSELVVLVLDDEGNPVRGVPLAVLSKKPDQWVGLIKRSTLGTGMAHFSGISQFSNRASKDIPLAVGFHFPHNPRVWHEIDPEWLPEDLIEMQLPPHAPLTIRVLDGDGKPLEGTFTIEVGMAVGEPGKRATPILRRRGAKGEVTFPFVGAQASLRVQLGGQSELKELIVDIRGPAAGEEDAVREIQWYEKRLRVNGRLRGPGGTLANRDVRASWGDGRNRRSIPITTDADGNFSVPMSGVIGGNLHLVAMPKGGDRPSEGSVALPQPLPQGEWNAGVVILKGQDLFAEGRVVDELGKPVVGAMVRLEKWGPGAPSRSGGKRGAGNKGGGAKGGEGKGDAGGKNSGAEKKGDVGHWSPAGRLFALTDENGRFKIYGKAYGNRFRLTASHREFLSQSIEEVQKNMPPWYFNLQPGVQPPSTQSVLSDERN